MALPTLPATGLAAWPLSSSSKRVKRSEPDCACPSLFNNSRWTIRATAHRQASGNRKRGRLGITGAEREGMDSGPVHPYTAPRSQFPRSIKSDRAVRLFFGKTGTDRRKRRHPKPYHFLEI